MSSARQIILIVVAVLLAGLFTRLGLWQLGRHAERKAAHEARTERQALPALDWTSADAIPDDTAGVVGRDVRVAGRWAPEHEVILRSRSSDGRAGVEVLSPLRVGPAEPLLYVLRGWLPASDGLRVDLRAARSAADAGPVELAGTLISSRNGRGGTPLWVEVGERRHLALGGIDLVQIREHLSIAVSPHVIRAEDPVPGSGPWRPARAIQTGSGPHMSYAIQWFAFAAISVVGTGILLKKERR